MWQRIKEIYVYREMLRNLVHKELRARYKGSFLGFMWTFFNPLLLLIVYSFVFSFVMRVQLDNYSLYLFTGLLPWIFHLSSIMMGMESIVGNSNLITKIYFPREILPLSIVFANLINYILSLPILLLGILYFGQELSWSIIAFPVVLFIQLILVTGFTLIVSALNVFFRDLQHLLEVLMTGWFFMCPIVYPVSMVPEGIKGLYHYVNPVTPLILSYENIFYYAKFPDWNYLLYVFVIAVVIFVVGFYLFYYLQKFFAEEV